MSDHTLQYLIVGALAVHGLGNGGAPGALIWLRLQPGTGTGGWQVARSWLLPELSPSTTMVVASICWGVALAGFVAAAMGASGILLFAGTWPAFNTLAACGMDVAVLVALPLLHRPSLALFGD